MVFAMGSNTMLATRQDSPAPRFSKANNLFTSVMSATYYISVSVMLTTVNKIMFNRFPLLDASIIVIGQAITTVLVLSFLSIVGQFDLPSFRNFSTKSLLAYAVFFTTYAFTVLSSLVALRQTSLLMCNTLRRTSMLFVVVTHAVFHKSFPSRHTVLATGLILYGAFRASQSDLQVDHRSIATIFVANLSSSLYLVFVKPVRKTLNLTNIQLQFMNATLLVPVLYYMTYNSSSSVLFLYAQNVSFLALFTTSCGLAMIITHATYVNTSVNNAVTQVVAAQIKDVILALVSYIAVDDAASRADGRALGVLLSFGGSAAYAYGKVIENSRALSRTQTLRKRSRENGLSGSPKRKHG